MDRVLLLSARFGTGHRLAAQAVAEACRQSGAHAAEADLESGLLDLVSTGYLKLLATAPSAYRSLYQAPVSAGVRAFIRSMLDLAVRREIARTQPTAVVATHPFPGLVAAHLRQLGRLSAPVVMAVTDFVPHPVWVAEGIDLYCVASASAARRLQILGVPAARVRATGIPVRAAFTPRHPGGDHKQVLVMGGGLGLGPIVEAVRGLAQLPHRNLRVAVICGTNERLHNELVDLFGADERITIFGYTDQVPALMQQADLLVTKPGGISCSEALAAAVPMLLLPPLPGQEEENATYLTEIGAAQSVPVPWLGRTAAQLLYEEPYRSAVMRERARVAGRPGAAAAIANEILTVRKPNLHGEATG